MGLFDTVNFTCPDCGSNVEVQSKAGQCCLADISESEVPKTIAEDINGKIVACNECEKVFTVGKIEEPVETVKMGLK
jgi:transcription elongation factor Elf1